MGVDFLANDQTGSESSKFIAIDFRLLPTLFVSLLLLFNLINLGLFLSSSLFLFDDPQLTVVQFQQVATAGWNRHSHLFTLSGESEILFRAAPTFDANQIKMNIIGRRKATCRANR